MAPPSGTIDLGELPPHDEVRLEPDPWWPGARFRRWRGRRAWQLAGAAAVTALTAVTTTAAAAPPGPALTRQFAVAGSWGVYDEQALYVIDGEDEAGSRFRQRTVELAGPLRRAGMSERRGPPTPRGRSPHRRTGVVG